MDYPWYEILDNTNELQQGDFILNCEVLIPPKSLKTGDTIEVEVKLMDAIILSQSCDLINKHVEIVLVCPYSNLTAFLLSLPHDQTQTSRAREKIKENLRKGYFPAYHLLNKQEGLVDDYLVVDFRNVYGLHISTLNQKITQTEKRLRLLPPYREHLSQSFARYFMRVGLPQDIKFTN